jgi:ABC-2 type transport system permease protein
VTKAADQAAKLAANQAEADERGRRKNAARRARNLMEKKADAMPAAPTLGGPKLERFVDAELVDPSPTGGIVEVFQQHYLLRLIVTRQLAQQYAASVLGLLWSYIQPAMRFGVYYLIFGVVLQTHAGTPNFALRLFAGMVFVHYFSETWSSGTRSVRQNRSLLLKMRMPREMFPVASMMVALYHTGPQVLILMFCCALVGWHFSIGAIAAGLLGFAILMIFAMAMALFFSALNVLYKDFQNIVATFTQFTHFLVPMMYPFATVHHFSTDHPVMYQLYMANPLAEAVLLMQKLFWWPTLSVGQRAEVQKNASPVFPSDLWERGLIMLAVCIVLLYLAQKFFTAQESKFPERL